MCKWLKPNFFGALRPEFPPIQLTLLDIVLLNRKIGLGFHFFYEKSLETRELYDILHVVFPAVQRDE
jgi:hypothetical protein